MAASIKSLRKNLKRVIKTIELANTPYDQLQMEDYEECVLGFLTHGRCRGHDAHHYIKMHFGISKVSSLDVEGYANSDHTPAELMVIRLLTANVADNDGYISHKKWCKKARKVRKKLKELNG